MNRKADMAPCIVFQVEAAISIRGTDMKRDEPKVETGFEALLLFLYLWKVVE